MRVVEVETRVDAGAGGQSCSSKHRHGHDFRRMHSGDEFNTATSIQRPKVTEFMFCIGCNGGDLQDIELARDGHLQKLLSAIATPGLELRT